MILKIFNTLGQEVASLVEGAMEAGRHRVQWDATGLPRRVYVYRLKADGFGKTKKLILVR